jgi:hypothetical protein
LTIWSRSTEGQALRVLTRDGRLLFSTRMVRLFAYGFLSVVLALYLIVRTAASAISPTLTGVLLGASLLRVPFFLAGGMKILYDVLLYRSFDSLRPPEE